MYHKTLAERLSDEKDLQDPEKRKHAMTKEVDWYKGILAKYIQMAESTGKIQGSVKKMLKPVLRLVSDVFGEYYINY